MLLGILGLAVSAAFCAAAAEAFRRKILPAAPRDTALLLVLLFATALQSLMILGAGVAGLLSPIPLTLLSAAGLGALAFARLLPTLPRPLFERPVGVEGWILAAGAALLAVSLLVKTLLFSPYWGDALYYHLLNVAEWIQSGRLAAGFCAQPRIWWPMGFELLETWWCVFLHHDALIELAGAQMLFLAALSIRVIARVHGADPRRAALLFAFIPAVILHATSCGNDLAAAAWVLAAYALAADRLPRALQAFPLIVSAGVKPTAVFAAAGVALYAFRARPRMPLGRAPALCLLAGALLLGGYWYARNWAVKGHPLYPVYGQEGLESHRGNPVEGFDTLRGTLEELPKRMVDRGRYSVLSSDMTSWGWFVLPWGIPLTLLAARRNPEFRRLALSFTAGAMAAIALSPLNQFNLRFALWFPALFALGAALTPSRPLLAALVVTSLLNFAATLVPVEIAGAERLRPPADFPLGEPLAVVAGPEAPGYLYYNADLRRRVHYPQSMAELREI